MQPNASGKRKLDSFQVSRRRIARIWRGCSLLFVAWKLSLFLLCAVLTAWAIPIRAADAPGASAPKTNALQAERVIVVQGEVERPGRFSWTEGVTLTNAVELAGGFTPFADTARVIIRRENGSRERHSYARIIRGQAKNPTLKPNDSVEVRCF